MSFGDVGGAQALVIGFGDPAPAIELARDGLLVNAIVKTPGAVRRWRSKARDALPRQALERLSVIAAAPDAIEAPPEVYARIVIGPDVSWPMLADPGAWVAHLLSPRGRLVMHVVPGPDPACTLCELIGPILGECRLLAVDRDDRHLIASAERVATAERAPDGAATDMRRALAGLALDQAARASEREQLIAGLRGAVAARDSTVLAQRERLATSERNRLVTTERNRPATIEHTASDDLATLGPRTDTLAERIASSRRAVRVEHEQLAAMLASVDELLARRSHLAPTR